MGSIASYPNLQGSKANSYKCFILRAWEIGNTNGLTGFLHPDGVYDDPKSGEFRAAIYLRLRGHFQYINELSLFPEVAHIAKYSINIFSCSPSMEPFFHHVSNLYHPSTVDGCHAHDGAGLVPGIKTDDNEWELKPHQSRLICVDKERLSLFAKLYDEAGTPWEQARLPFVHSAEIVSVLKKIATHPNKLGDLGNDFFSTQNWNETTAQQDGTIRRETRFPKNVGEWILSGPHFFVGTPLNKTPNEGCNEEMRSRQYPLTHIL